MRFRRRRQPEEQAAGEDSFLDVVANLVGILVILVTVLGVRTQDAWQEQSDQTESAPAAAASAGAAGTELVAQRQRVEAEHNSLAKNVFEVQYQADRLAELLDARRRERHQLQVLMTAARLELDERRAALNQSQQEQVAMSAEARELADELTRIESQRRVLENEARRPIKLEHLPTPLARTVFGNEEHFRLKGHRLVYVPLNELTEKLSAEAPRRVYRLREVPEVTETIGPVQGFHLRYTLQRRTVETNTPAGPLIRQIAELQQFVLLPLSDDLGEPLETALQAGSQFRQLIESMRPGATVITVWTYPDSYGDFRQLKQWLFEQGFATAARPLPDGQPITGSPAGSRSAAQ